MFVLFTPNALSRPPLHHILIGFRFALRRVAVRAISFQTRQQSTIAPVSRTPFAQASKPTLLRSFHQARICRADEQKTPAEKGEASPAEAETSGETVTTEPSSADISMKEESIATPEAADAAGEATSASQQPHPAAQDAVSESSGTTSAPLGQSERAPQQSGTLAEKAQDVASSAAQTARSAAESATEAGRDALSAVTASRPMAQPSRILYVGNLFFEVTAPQLEQEFSQFGTITNSRIVTDTRGLSKGFGYVEFSNQQEADQAIKELDQRVFQGRRMAVQYHVRRQPKNEFKKQGMQNNPPSKTLFIGNMSYQMSDKDLNGMFDVARSQKTSQGC